MLQRDHFSQTSWLPPLPPIGALLSGKLVFHVPHFILAEAVVCLVSLQVVASSVGILLESENR